MPRKKKPKAINGTLLTANRNSGSSPVLDLRRYVPALLVIISNKFTAAISKLLRKRFGIGTTEWRVMAMIAIEPWITSNRICQVIGFDKAAVSRTVHFLVAEGLLVTRPNGTSNRSLEYKLSRSGQTLHDKIIAISFERERRLLSKLSKQEVALFTDFLNRVHTCIPLMDSPENDAAKPRETRRRAKAGRAPADRLGV